MIISPITFLAITILLWAINGTIYLLLREDKGMTQKQAFFTTGGFNFLMAFGVCFTFQYVELGLVFLACTLGCLLIYTEQYTKLGDKIFGKANRLGILDTKSRVHIIK